MSLIAKAASALRTAKKKHQIEQQQNSCGDVVGDWQPHSRNFTQNTLNKVKTEVSFDPRGKHELIAVWPGFAYCSLVEPSADPINFKNLIANLIGQIASQAEKSTTIAAEKSSRYRNPSMGRLHYDYCTIRKPSTGSLSFDYGVVPVPDAADECSAAAGSLKALSC